MSTISLRRLRPDDSIDELTALLHRSFARLGASGMNCSCVGQTSETTRQRIGLGECLVALAGSRLVGTVTLQTADPQSDIAWYRQPHVASLHQLAVEPGRQGTGIGRALLQAAEAWAAKRRCAALALDTPEPARHLQAYYTRRGFARHSTAQVAGRGYASVVLSKPVQQAPCAPQNAGWPPRHPAELLLMAKQGRSTGRAAGRAATGAPTWASEARSSAGLSLRQLRGWPR